MWNDTSPKSKFIPVYVNQLYDFDRMYYHVIASQNQAIHRNPLIYFSINCVIFFWLLTFGAPIPS